MVDSRPVLYIIPVPESDHRAYPTLPEHARSHLHVAPVGCVLAPGQRRPWPVCVRRRPIGRLRLLRLLVLVPVRDMQKGQNRE